jgi:hypothetical protein
VGIGPKFTEGIALGDPDRLKNFDVAARRIEFAQSNLIDRGDKSGSAAIHDRRFRTVQFDDRVVDTESTEGCENMFGRRYQRTGGITQNGRKFRRCDRMDVGTDFPVRLVFHGGTNEQDAGIGIGRMDCECNRKAGMNTDARYGSLVAKTCLLAAPHAVSHFVPAGCLAARGNFPNRPRDNNARRGKIDRSPD